MKQIISCIIILQLFVLSFFISCSSSTQLTNIWIDDYYQTQGIKKVLVLGVAKENWKKKVFENEFRQQLIKKNVDAISAWELLPEGEKLNKETFEKYFNDENIDAVLVARAIGTSTEETVFGGGASHIAVGFYGFYFSTAQLYYTQSYTAEEKIVHMKADLYETSEGKLIWSATSRSYEPKNTSVVIKSVSRQVVEEISRSALFYK
ncbi:MAG: hypothetical protein O6940_06580 [Ignavibacteria bacterium]|nr:hypothetical protein [Ignavibacteria bacterium]